MTLPTPTKNTMMATYEAVAEHNRRVEQVCPVNTMAKWDAIKAAFYVAVASAAFWVTQMGSSNPTTAMAIFMAVLMVIYYGAEVNEVRVAGILTIIMNGNNGGD